MNVVPPIPDPPDDGWPFRIMRDGRWLKCWPVTTTTVTYRDPAYWPPPNPTDRVSPS